MRRLISAQIYRVYLAPVFQSRIMSLRFSTSHSSSTLSPTSTRYTCMGVTHTNFALQQQALSGLYVVHRHGCYAYKFRTPAASSIRPLRGTPAWALHIQISLFQNHMLSPTVTRYTYMIVTQIDISDSVVHALFRLLNWVLSRKNCLNLFTNVDLFHKLYLLNMYEYQYYTVKQKFSLRFRNMYSIACWSIILLYPYTLHNTHVIVWPSDG